MAGDMMEARRHIEALLEFIDKMSATCNLNGLRPTAYSGAQTFLGGEGQRVEGGDDWQAKFKAHTEAVQDFLAEMIAVYDPCASGEMQVREICAFLVKQATDDRQRFYEQEAELTRRKAEQSDIRNAALEEAAKVADDEVAFWHGFSPACETAGKRIARNIRALISRPDGGQT